MAIYAVNYTVAVAVVHTAAVIDPIARYSSRIAIFCLPDLHSTPP